MRAGARRGTTTVEYALLIGLVSLAVLAAFTALRDRLVLALGNLLP